MKWRGTQTNKKTVIVEGKFWVFFLFDFEQVCFILLTLFYLSKKHVLVTCSKILLNITAKITLGCKV